MSNFVTVYERKNNIVPFFNSYVDKYDILCHDIDEKDFEGNVKYKNGNFYVHSDGNYNKLEIELHTPEIPHIDIGMIDEIICWYIENQAKNKQIENIVAKYPEAKKAKELYEKVINTLIAMEKVTDSDYVE